MAELFKGFKQVLEKEGLKFEQGYLYFVRTNADKSDGYLYLNGKKYGTAEDVKKEILGNIGDEEPNTIAGLLEVINELQGIVGDGFSGSSITNEVAELKSTVATLTSGDTSINAIIESAIEALDLPNTYEEKGAAATAEQNAKDYTDDVVSSATTRISTLEGKAHEHENEDVLDGITSAKVTAWDNAEQNAKTYAKEYADGLAKKYDAAGAADSALTAAKAYTDELANGAVKTNTEAIAKLNGTGEGSVSKQVADAIAEVVANAPADFDTLKEIADYIANDQTGAADLANRVSALEGKAHEHENEDVLDGITSAKVTAWDNAEQNAKTYAKEYADGLAKKYDAAGAADSALTAAKAYAKEYADGLAGNYDAKGAAASAETAAKTYADGLNTAMNTRVETLEGASHGHTNKAELDSIQSGDVAKWNAAITIDGDDVN